MTLQYRVSHLEAAHAAAVEAFQARPHGERQRVLDGVVHALIEEGLCPPPDPQHPDWPIDRTRQTDPLAFQRWVAATFQRPCWWQAHKQVIIPRTLTAIEGGAV